MFLFANKKERTILGVYRGAGAGTSAGNREFGSSLQGDQLECKRGAEAAGGGGGAARQEKNDEVSGACASVRATSANADATPSASPQLLPLASSAAKRM